MLVPLLIGDVLSMLGLPHVVVVAVMAVAAWSHGQDLLHAVSFALTMARTGTWIVVVVGVLGAAAVLGFIPGVSASIKFSALGAALDRVGDLLPILP